MHGFQFQPGSTKRPGATIRRCYATNAFQFQPGSTKSGGGGGGEAIGSKYGFQFQPGSTKSYRRHSHMGRAKPRFQFQPGSTKSSKPLWRRSSPLEKFQFQPGSTKSVLAQIYSGLVGSCFNSSLVLLKVRPLTAPIRARSACFNSSLVLLKEMREIEAANKLRSFNSSLVLLKAAQAHN